MQSPESRNAEPAHADPQDVSDLLGRARTAQQRGDPQEAVRLLLEASGTAPAPLNILIELGNALRALGRMEEAEAIFVKVLDRAPGYTAALVGLGHIARHRDNDLTALEFYENAAKGAPGNLNIQAEIGNVLRALLRQDNAESVFRRILEQESKHFGALLGLGHISRDRKNWRVALEHYESASQIRPDDINIQVEIAHLLGELRQLDDAAAL